MNYRQLRIALLALAALHVIGARGFAGDDPSEPLGQRVGIWVTKATFKKAEWTPKERTVTGEETIRWILDKQFIHGTQVNEDSVKSHWLMNYDQEAKVYRLWYFDNKNAFPRGDSIGRWNAKTKTMNVTSDIGNGLRGSGSLKHVSEDHFEWSFTIRDRDGKLMLDTYATLKRKK